VGKVKVAHPRLGERLEDVHLEEASGARLPVVLLELGAVVDTPDLMAGLYVPGCRAPGPAAAIQDPHHSSLSVLMAAETEGGGTREKRERREQLFAMFPPFPLFNATPLQVCGLEATDSEVQHGTQPLPVQITPLGEVPRVRPAGEQPALGEQLVQCGLGQAEW